MKLEDEEFTVAHGTARTTLGGVLRLPSPEAYERTLAPVRAALEGADDGYTLDVSDATFMNSSGIRALANLVLLARRNGRELRLIGNAAIPWQRKTMASLGALHDGLRVELM